MDQAGVVVIKGALVVVEEQMLVMGVPTRMVLEQELMQQLILVAEGEVCVLLGLRLELEVLVLSLYLMRALLLWPLEELLLPTAVEV
jgi:hypothetical protein